MKYLQSYGEDDGERERRNELQMICRFSASNYCNACMRVSIFFNWAIFAVALWRYYVYRQAPRRYQMNRGLSLTPYGYVLVCPVCTCKCRYTVVYLEDKEKWDIPRIQCLLLRSLSRILWAIRVLNVSTSPKQSRWERVAKYIFVLC